MLQGTGFYLGRIKFIHVVRPYTQIQQNTSRVTPSSMRHTHQEQEYSLNMKVSFRYP